MRASGIENLNGSDPGECQVSGSVGGGDPPTRSDQTEGGSLRLKKYERGGMRQTPCLNHE